MKKYFAFLILLGLVACDDGDIIVENFDFEDEQVRACLPDSGSTDYVFYKLNNATFESIVLGFDTSAAFLIDELTVDPIAIDGTTNFFQYRRFNSAIPTDYYCSNIPPALPMVEQIIEATAGDIMISSNRIAQDDDNDGIPSFLEGIVIVDGEVDDEQSQDTDGDGIPDYRDIDDDGDNVLTSQEGVIIINNLIDDTSRNTDGTDNPDYLDKDDDNDGIPTIQEDLNMDLNPLNDVTNNIPNYLLETVTETAIVPISEFRPHQFTRSLDIDISIENLLLTNAELAELIDRNFEFGTFRLNNATILVTPNFVP
ncbi:MAG: hypothetical protein WBA16_12615 [Nonlabens sp.]